MALSAFPYIGGKTHLASWIVSHLPEHRIYVEPFGGSAAVLLEKKRSQTEVFNDLDGDVVHFFQVARDRPDDLAEWCRRTPFSEELHERWVEAFYSGERPADDIERAGRFLFLRYAQHGGKYHAPSGFKRDTPAANPSKTWAGVTERIEWVCERFQGVSIQQGPFQRVVEDYDAAETVYYCDPPYLSKSLYRKDVAHGQLEATLDGIEGYALVSYTERPDGLYDGWTEVTQEREHHAGSREGGTTKSVTERLICNFDPAEVEPFVQKRLTDLWSKY